MTDYLTHREAAQALLDGKKMTIHSHYGFQHDIDPDTPSPYRLAPETITVNGFVVPKPEAQPLKEGETYWTATMLDKNWARSWHWTNGGEEHRWLSRGLIHSTQAAAVAHAKAMCGIDPGAV